MRDGKPLSQAKAGADVGADQSTWWDWEQGDKQPRLDQALAIEQLTGGVIRVADWAMTLEERKARKRKRARRRTKPRPSSPPPDRAA